MVDISSQNNKINVTVSSSGNTANTNVTPDYAQYYSEKSKEWATSNRIVDNTDYSSKYYANESKKQADISTAKTTEVVESGNTAVSNIENARDNAIFDVNTAGATQVALATEQATIATNKASEVVASGNEALSNIDTAKNGAITSITNQETTSKNVLIDEGAIQIGLIQNEGATQIANVQSTGFYMRDDKLYFINSQGEETEFKSGGSGLEVCDIGMALYVDETKGLRRYLNGQIVDINTNTQLFLNRLLKIQTANPDYFTTESNWQAEKTMNIDGCVYKFVLNYDSTGTNVVSVRLPKYPDYVEINNNSINNTAPVAVYGNGKALGLYTGDAQMGVVQNFSVPGDDRGLQGWYTGNNPPSVVPLGHNSESYGYARYATNGRAFGVHPNPTYSGLAGTATITSNFRQTKLKLRYFIQIATGQETENNITNEIELNNPSFFGDSKYVPTAVNNLSWLKSEGQNNPKGTYPSFYDWILENVNNGTENFKSTTGYGFRNSDTEHSDWVWWISTETPHVGQTVYTLLDVWKPNGIISSLTENGFVFTTIDTPTTFTTYRDATTDRTDWITDYDWVINTADETFRLPLLDGSENLPSDRYDDLELLASGSSYTAPANGWFVINKSSSATNQYVNIRNASNGLIWENKPNASGSYCSCFLPVKRGDIAKVFYTADGATQVFRFIYAQGNGSLYYYVGETVQNANLMDAGRIGEILPTKTDMQQASGAGMPSNKYIDLTLGASGTKYTAPANGWFSLGGLDTIGEVSNYGFVMRRGDRFGLESRIGNTAITGWCNGILPVRKGDVVYIYHNMKVADSQLRFYYAEGAQ